MDEIIIFFQTMNYVMIIILLSDTLQKYIHISIPVDQYVLYIGETSISNTRSFSMSLSKRIIPREIVDKVRMKHILEDSNRPHVQNIDDTGLHQSPALCTIVQRCNINKLAIKRHNQTGSNIEVQMNSENKQTDARVHNPMVKSTKGFNNI